MNEIVLLFSPYQGLIAFGKHLHNLSSPETFKVMSLLVSDSAVNINTLRCDKVNSHRRKMDEGEQLVQQRLLWF